MSKKNWQPELALLFFSALFICFALGQVAILILYKTGARGFQRPEDFGNILLATLSFQGAAWILIPIFLRLHEIKWRDAFGLRKSDLFLPLALAIATFIVVLPVALGLESICAVTMEKMGWHPRAQAAVEMLTDSPLWPTGIYLGFFAVVLAPVAEEFIFRGVLFPVIRQSSPVTLAWRLRKQGWPRLAWFFRRRFSKIVAWIGVSLLFALVHGDVAIFAPLFVLALALTWLYEKTDGLLAPIIVHSLFNSANLVIFYYEKAHGAL